MNLQDIKKGIIRFVTNNKKAVLISVGVILFMIVMLLVIRSFKANSEVLTLDSKTSDSSPAKEVGDGDYDYTEAVDHIGEKATVTGTVQKVFTSKSGTVFFDFCDNFQTCTFSAVIFASDVPKFKDLEQYQREVKLTGVIKSYQGKAEIILNGPEQIE